MNAPALQIENLSKSFTLHHQGATSFNVFDDINFAVNPGECVVLHGESGLGKSTLLRCLYANYLTDGGHIHLNQDEQSWDLTRISQREMIRLRRDKIAYVSQFLRVIPRVSAFDIILQPLLDSGVDRDTAGQRVISLLHRLHIPERLWTLSPTTFSGGEQQRINIAREFAVHRPVMLLDEPTASLDASNRRTVLELIAEAKQRNAAIVGIFHDEESRERVADRIFDLKTGQFND
jgi:alpha-D-ribose 1-methylphosphonate 5-triphosphate synthase subunit PhnL